MKTLTPLTVEDVLADTPSAALARAGHPGLSNRAALAVLDEADRLWPFAVTYADILDRSYRYAQAFREAVV